MTLLVRPMRLDDLAACEAITRAAYYEVDRATFQRSWPDPAPRSEAGRADWLAKSRHKLATDPGGCWVAEEDGVVVGLATSLRRELMWILCSFAVAPEAQGRGLGTLLLDAATHYGDGCLRGMFIASQDQGALHRYRRAGFDLHPQMVLWGIGRRAPCCRSCRTSARARPATATSATASTGVRAAPPTAPTTRSSPSSSGWSSSTTRPARATPTSRRTGGVQCLAADEPADGRRAAVGVARRRPTRTPRSRSPA